MMTTRKCILAIVMLAAVLVAPALAGERTAVVSIPDMECGSLQIQANMALSGLSGVESVEIDGDEKKATVTFDDEAVTIEDMNEALGKFSMSIGEVTYPGGE
jgi:copper chaperone CopZ